MGLEMQTGWRWGWGWRWGLEVEREMEMEMGLEILIPPFFLITHHIGMDTG